MAARKNRATEAPKTDPETTPPPVNAPAPQDLGRLWSAARPASQLGNLSKLKILLTGASGGGKTTTGAKFERPLYAPTELQAIPIIQHVNPDALIFHNSDGRPGIRDARDLQQFRAMIKDPTLADRVDAVVLDSLTDCQRIIKDSYTRAQTSGRKTTDQDTWGAIIELTARLAREVRDLDVHVLVTALDKEVEINGRMVHRPSVSGKHLPNDLAQYFNLVGFSYAEEMDSGGVRNSTMFRAGSDRYTVKKLPQLDDIEPPEPLMWISKVFGATADQGTTERVAAWVAADAGQGDPDPGETDETDETESEDEKKSKKQSEDPFADLNT